MKLKLFLFTGNTQKYKNKNGSDLIDKSNNKLYTQKLHTIFSCC